MSTTNPKIVIIGGSLAGLTLALACAVRGIPVVIVERSSQRKHGGDSLTIDPDALAATVGYDPRNQPILPVVSAYRPLTTWSALYSWLYARAVDTPNILIEENKNVNSVENFGEQAKIIFSDGTVSIVDAVIGADGYQSIVRRAIAPDEPFATYAGYLVWRGLVDEQKLKGPVSWPSNGGLWIELVKGYRLVAAVLPGKNGSIEIGQRQITFAWFDVNQKTLLRETNCLTEDGYIVKTLARGMIDKEVRNKLVKLVPQLWPEIWAEAVTVGLLSDNVVSGAPICEYKPQRLAYGALAIIGDAAHVISPMTGRGFATGVDDAMLLANMLANRQENEPISSIFSEYNTLRLPFIQALVTHSKHLSSNYVSYAHSN